ncbi:Hypothetical protein HVR_LOCUS510, partial [uncultured virus]
VKCEFSFFQSIDKHINKQSGCRKCAKREPWSLIRFLTVAKIIHGEKYDYTQITEQHINGCNSRVPIFCYKCQRIWNPTIGHHINSQSKCPNCAISREYSQGQINWLELIMEDEDIDIQYVLSPEKEYYIPGVGRVDGYCENNTVYECHGSFWLNMRSMSTWQDFVLLGMETQNDTILLMSIQYQENFW